MTDFENYIMSLDIFKNRKPLYVFQLNDNGDYDNRDVYDLHHAWQASASREGFKLVPVEKLEELKRDADRMVSSAHLYQDESHIKSFGRSFLHNYKAMMGVMG